MSLPREVERKLAENRAKYDVITARMERLAARCYARAGVQNPDIARNLAEIILLEVDAVRITGRPGARVFEMADGRLLTIKGEQPRDSDLYHLQYVLPVSREDAEDLYGWSPA